MPLVDFFTARHCCSLRRSALNASGATPNGRLGRTLGAGERQRSLAGGARVQPAPRHASRIRRIVASGGPDRWELGPPACCARLKGAKRTRQEQPAATPTCSAAAPHRRGARAPPRSSAPPVSSRFPPSPSAPEFRTALLRCGGKGAPDPSALAKTRAEPSGQRRGGKRRSAQPPRSSNGVRSERGRDMTVIKAGGAEPCGDGGGAYEAWRRQSLRARYAYGFVFFATNLLAWFVRDYGARALRGLHRGFFSSLPFPKIQL